MNEALEKALVKARLKRMEMKTLGIKQRTKFDAFNERDTRKTAIEAQCCHCMGGPDNDGYTSLVRDCTCGPDSSLPCFLYNWRPYK